MSVRAGFEVQQQRRHFSIPLQPSIFQVQSDNVAQLNQSHFRGIAGVRCRPMRSSGVAALGTGKQITCFYTDSMNLPDRVPNEVWLEILENFHVYDKSTIQNFSLTCRTFRKISRPRIFSDLRFTPYCRGRGATLLLPSPAGVDRRLEPLDFVFSPDVAPLVRSCNIWAREPRDLPEWTFSTDNPYFLLDALFNRLPRLAGLQRLHASHIHFTQARIDMLCSLPSLSEVHPAWCPVTPGEHIEPTSSALRITNFDIVHDKDEHGDDHWIPLLHPDHLRVFRADFNPCFMGKTIHAIPRFPNVYKFVTTMNLPTLSENLAILSKFPAVRLLKVQGNLSDLIAHIQALCGNNVTSFHAEFNKIDNTALNKLFGLLPRLTELTIRLIVSSTSRLFKREIYDPRKLPDNVVVDGRSGDEIRTDFRPSAFFIKFADAPFIPPGLEHLAISWQCYEEFYDQFSAYKLPDFPQLRDALVARSPGLKWLWLNGLYFMFEWRDPMPDGTIREFATKNFSAQYFFASGLMLTFRCSGDLRARPTRGNLSRLGLGLGLLAAKSLDEGWK
ncbi:hypothetical protein DFH08DRAFT_799813 [Mycena albidolilacea]|uniref:F-box domain-containing protein n=1 Tax=Mycena albidolilacea TaxID=1033008 RepID=A0AAD7AM34_9AGAR|nr:hypothetical protein DFH08DRAFT_799813 [Mycena albidolilacea]